MPRTQTGGATSAVAASAHAQCERFKGTDPLIVGMSRRRLAAQLGNPDTTAGIPEARWMRAMAFERLVRDDKFVSPLLTTAVGKLGLRRPDAVRRVDCSGRTGSTAEALRIAHDKACAGEATLLTSLGVPYLGLESDPTATAVQPDFAIVASRYEQGEEEPRGSWLIMGDAKDYERVRSRIDDRRMLKGFLQVAMGAESARAWSVLPDAMEVHRFGAIAVPRNSFLQPTAEIEDLSDHCREVRSRADERRHRFEDVGAIPLEEADLGDFVNHLAATFDPASCATCALFTHCRQELRDSDDPLAVLVEIGVVAERRHALAGIVDGVNEVGEVPASLRANVEATTTGMPSWTGRKRIDPAGQPGTIDVVVAKSDAAALGIYGLSIRHRSDSGEPTEWRTRVFRNPQAPETRLTAMALLGEALSTLLTERAARPIHLVVPESATADLLASVADSLAGVEIARLRWEHDRAMGREPLRFDGTPADIPHALNEHQRLAVSFLLEEDRARAMSLRSTVVDLRRVLAGHVVAGGPATDAGRLDYLVEWASAEAPLDHRAVSDQIAASEHTPGARLSNLRSDEIHAASRSGRSAGGPDLTLYGQLIEEELDYKRSILEAALRVLDEHVAPSSLRIVHEELESASQEVWRRRLEFRAYDLVRFGRTSDFWRDANVGLLEADEHCRRVLEVLGNPHAAQESALDAGVRDVAFATVAQVKPLRLEVASRRIGEGDCVAAVLIDGTSTAETHGDHKVLAGSFQFPLPHGVLAEPDSDGAMRWDPAAPVAIKAGARLVIVSCEDFFDGTGRGGRLKLNRPDQDTKNAPSAGCEPDSYAHDPEGHRWCCRSHEQAESDTADWIAEKRANGQMNPDVWPPVVDDDAFDIAVDAPVDSDVAASQRVPNDLTMDDIE